MDSNSVILTSTLSAVSLYPCHKSRDLRTGLMFLHHTSPCFGVHFCCEHEVRSFIQQPQRELTLSKIRQSEPRLIRELPRLEMHLVHGGSHKMPFPWITANFSAASDLVFAERPVEVAEADMAVGEVATEV